MSISTDITVDLLIPEAQQHVLIQIFALITIYIGAKLENLVGLYSIIPDAFSQETQAWMCSAKCKTFRRHPRTIRYVKVL